jgi:hypothetical protein
VRLVHDATGRFTINALEGDNLIYGGAGSTIYQPVTLTVGRGASLTLQNFNAGTALPFADSNLRFAGRNSQIDVDGGRLILDYTRLFAEHTIATFRNGASLEVTGSEWSGGTFSKLDFRTGSRLKLDHITEVKQQNLDANRVTQERIQALEISLQGVGQLSSPETSTQTVDLIAKHIKSQALTGVEKISTLMSNNNKTMANVVTAEIGQLLDQKLQALKSDLQGNLLDFETQVKLDQEKLSSLLNQSGKIDQLLKLKVSSSAKASSSAQASDALSAADVDKNTIITFATGLLCGFTFLLGGMAIYNLAFKDDFAVHSAHQVSETKNIKHESAHKSTDKASGKSVEKAAE